MENKIVYSEDVREYLNNLVSILFSQNYFSDPENAYNYVVDLLDDIENYIHTKRAKTPRYRRRCYGKNTKYVTFRKNKNTSYIVFFEFVEGIYLIEYIGNNHTDAHYIGRL